MFFSVVPSEEGGGVGNLSPSPAAPVEVDIFVEKVDLCYSRVQNLDTQKPLIMPLPCSSLLLRQIHSCT